MTLKYYLTFKPCGGKLNVLAAVSEGGADNLVLTRTNSTFYSCH